jgi:outer membrane protein assembly factor BamB
MPYVLRAIPVILALAAVAALALWLSADPTAGLTVRVETLGERETGYVEVAFPGHFVKGDGAAADLPGSWPRFRGPRYDAVSTEDVPLARAWPADGPPQLWSTDVGIGYAAPAVHEGRVYLMDYDETKRGDALRCLSLADGAEIWRRWYEMPIDSDHGISRTVPAVAGGVVVGFGPKCTVLAADAATGDFRWGMDLVKDYGSQWPKWYAGQCPLIDGGRVILAPAGPDVLMLAADAATGTVAWKTPNPKGWKMTHSSVMPFDLAGTRMYVYAATGGVTAVAAADGPGHKAGDVLWQRDDWQVKFANVPSPVDCGEGRILLSGGYGSGSMMIRVKAKDGGGFDTEVLWRFEKSKDFGSEQQTPIYHKGHVFAVLPKEAGALGERMLCMTPDGKQVWTSGRTDRFGLGPYTVADGLLFVMNDDGRLTMAEASPDAWRPLASAQVLVDGHETWAPIAVAGGRMLVRDLHRLVCLDVQKKP